MKIGVENACLLDLDTGIVSGQGGSVIIDETLLSKIAFIKEGEFVETKGKPTLRLIGDIEQVGTGKIVVKETTRKVVKAIEPNDIVRAFLIGTQVEEPMEYVKALCSASSANYPIYFLLDLEGNSVDEAIKTVEETKSRAITKENLLNRLNGKRVPQASASTSGTTASQKKSEFRSAWKKEELNVDEADIGYCLTALMSLSKYDITTHEAYIRKKLLEIYEHYYEEAKSTVASDLRKAICRVDEVLHIKEA